MTEVPGDSGVYLFVFDVHRPAAPVVGSLGPIALGPGRYGYVGSARRGLAARLARHARRRKPRRWHIDYLARIGTPAGAIAWPWRERRECRLAEALSGSGAGRRHVPRFGASDCRCPGHLFAVAERDLDSLAHRLSERLGASATLTLRYD